MHHNKIHAIEDYNNAKARLHEELCNMGLGDIEDAYAAYGYTGMRPLRATFKECTDKGVYVYVCEWYDDSTYDTGKFIVGNVYVQVKDGKIVADS